MPKNELLPSGFCDVLPPQAAQESKITSKMLKKFEQWGYSQVKPPMVECDDVHSPLHNLTFRFMDTLSQKMLCVRADMTMQIARMASLRLKDKPRPLRLSYGGEVLRVRGSSLYAERQLTQVGLELIGDNSVASDAEVVIIGLDALKTTGADGVSVDFSMPCLSRVIMDDMAIDDSVREQLLTLIEQKDTAEINSLCAREGINPTNNSVIPRLDRGIQNNPVDPVVTPRDDDGKTYLLADLIDLAGDANTALPALRKLNLPPKAKEYCEYLGRVIEQVKTSIPDVKITIDPIERSGFEYHTGISFTFFSAKSNEELGRGGRYLIEGDNSENEENAVGFTLNINAIQRCLPIALEAQKILVSEMLNVKKLQDDGYITVCSLGDIDDMHKEAKLQQCSHIYINGKIQKIET